jgi:hypothetical protein
MTKFRKNSFFVKELLLILRILLINCNETMKRREFLRLSAYSGIVLSVPFVQSCKASPENLAITKPAFLSYILDKKSLVDAGKDYIRQFPVENTKSKLEEKLVNGSDIHGSTPAVAVYEFYDKKSVQDFDQNRTVVADGWVLSLTEARQCALFGLVQS